MHNPLATEEQRDAEALAIRLMASDQVAGARELVAMRWKTLAAAKAPQEAWGKRFDELIEEFAFNYCLKAVAGDPNHPTVAGMLYCPPHEWFGTRVPGSRGSGGDGPDQHYVLIPVEHGSRYAIHGKRFDPMPTSIPLTLIGNPSLTMTLGSLSLLDIDVAGDGTYAVTIGPEPGGRNHLQTRPGARWVFIRECRADWRQVPSHLEVERLDPPRTAPWSEAMYARLAASMMVEDVPAMHWFMSIFEAMERNSTSEVFWTGTVGGLVSQAIAFARLRLEDDDAYVFTVQPGDAPYRNIVLQDYWFRTIDYWERQSCLNLGQSRPNPDGSITYVVAHEDPGVANWLDPVGYRELLVVNRWQNMPGSPGDPGGPDIAGRHVPLADLESAVPDTVPMVTPEQRRADLQDRGETFLMRFEQ
jgi:hypothetical protein